jgi:hypothetical protein
MEAESASKPTITEKRLMETTRKKLAEVAIAMEDLRKLGIETEFRIPVGSSGAYELQGVKFTKNYGAG